MLLSVAVFFLQFWETVNKFDFEVIFHENTWCSAFEVTNSWHYTHLFISINFLPQVEKVPGVKNKKAKNQNVGWL